MPTEQPLSPHPPYARELTLEWIPQILRTMLDRARIRISLAQWQQLPLGAREQLTTSCLHEAAEPQVFAAALQAALSAANAGDVRPMA